MTDDFGGRLAAALAAHRAEHAKTRAELATASTEIKRLKEKLWAMDNSSREAVATAHANARWLEEKLLVMGDSCRRAESALKTARALDMEEAARLVEAENIKNRGHSTYGYVLSGGLRALAPMPAGLVAVERVLLDEVLVHLNYLDWVDEDPPNARAMLEAILKKQGEKP